MERDFEQHGEIESYQPHEEEKKKREKRSFRRWCCEFMGGRCWAENFRWMSQQSTRRAAMEV